MTGDHASIGHPARSVAVLWRTQERTSRKGKPALSVDRIARAGIELADTAGIGALSMRRVADALGVGTMSLYTYVPGKSELLDVMIDTVAGETARTVEQSDLSDAEWWSASAPLLEQLVDAARSPLARRVGTAAAGEAYNAASDPRHEFGFGLDRILDGIQMLLDSRREGE
jgi:AcrR family transcriptional regulator